MSVNLFHYGLSYALVGAILVSLSIFIFSRSGKNALFKIFALYNLAIAWWCLFSIPAIFSHNQNTAVYWCRTFIVGAIFIPTLFLHFAYLLLGYLKERKYRIILAISYLLSFVFIVFDFTPLFIMAAEAKQTLRSYTVPGPLFHFHVLQFVVIMFYGEVLFLKKYFQERGIIEGRKYLYFFVTAFVATIGGGANYFPVYRLEYPVINPFGTYLIILYALTVTYIIFKYNFLNVEVLIKKTLVFAGLFAASYAVLASFAYLGSAVFENVIQSRWVAIAPSVFIIVLILRPLESFLRNATDKYLFQKKYDYKKLLKTFTDEVITVLDLNKLVNLTVDNLADIMKLENATILLRDGENEEYRIVAAAGLEDAEYELPYSEEMVSRMKDSGEYVRFENSSAGKNADADIRRNMLDLQAVLAIPLMHQNNMVGILSLGKKKSDEEFAQDDIDILLPLAKTLSIAITNAQLFEKLSEAQAQAAQREKMAVIGTLSAGINHEICNPLGIARGQCEMFLLNLKEGIYKDKTPEELLEKARDIMEKVINETDRATVITRKLSSFAKPSSGIMSDDVNVEKELNEVISLVEHDLKLDNITVTKEISEGLPLIVADRKQLQEILFNIIRNAAQAIKDRGRILIRATSSNDKVYIDIEDTGSGMSKSHLAQIFNPFFTTKEPGKGTGLGLFIVKQIVERNRGRIAVKSDPGKGTTFYLRFDASRADDLKKGHGVRAEKG